MELIRTKKYYEINNHELAKLLGVEGEVLEVNVHPITTIITTKVKK